MKKQITKDSNLRATFIEIIGKTPDNMPMSEIEMAFEEAMLFWRNRLTKNLRNISKVKEGKHGGL